MNRRLQGAGFGISLMALVGVGSLYGGGVFAQDATPSPGTSITTETEDVTERNAFLDAFAAELGVTDEAAIDAAILGAYEQILSERVEEGDLTQEQADELLARIEAGEMPFGFGKAGRHHDGMRDGRGGPGGDRDWDRTPGVSDDDADATDDATTPGTEATPEAGTTSFL